MKFVYFFAFISTFNLNVVAQNKNVSDTKVRRKIVVFTKQMAKRNMIFGRAVGFGAEETTEYKVFKRFVEDASVNEIICLSKHKNPIIRGYVFLALRIIDKKEAGNLLPVLKKDEIWVDTNLHGCVPFPYKLKQFAEIMMNLTDDEILMYYKK